jgi:hypothetical protein
VLDAEAFTGRAGDDVWSGSATVAGALCSGPCVALVLARTDAVATLRGCLTDHGAASTAEGLRATFGCDNPGGRPPCSSTSVPVVLLCIARLLPQALTIEGVRDPHTIPRPSGTSRRTAPPPFIHITACPQGLGFARHAGFGRRTVTMTPRSFPSRSVIHMSPPR